VVNIIFFSLFISLSLSVQGETLVDPTAPLNYQQPKQKRKTTRAMVPKLQSIVITSGVPQAIINNKAYQQGQTVNGYLITLIDSQKVLLKYQKKIYTLTLYSSSERFSY